MGQTSSPFHRFAVAGSALLGATAAVMFMAAGFMLAGPRLGAEIAAQLTPLGREWYRPEYDLIIYVAGCAAAVAFVLGLHLTMRSRLAALGPGEAERFLCAWAWRGVILSSVVFASGVLGLKLVRGSPFGLSPRVVSLALIAGPAAMAMAAGCLGIRRGSPFDRWAARRRFTPAPEAVAEASGSAASIGGRLLFGLTALLIVAALYMPGCKELAGRAFSFDFVPFHHIDFFVVGPALKFKAGGALGTDTYAQYGVGWPMLLAWSDRFFPMNYGTTAEMASILGCLYFLGLLLFFRSLAGDAAWAAVGTVLVLLVQNFVGVDRGMTVWFQPSSSVLRSPMLLGVLWAMLRHARTGRLPWAVLAGASVGLALLFELDTGVYLLATLLLYFAWVVVQGPASRAGRWPAVAGGLVATVATLVSGLAVASRGTILRPEFWSGWLEGPNLYVGGMSALPINGFDRLLSVVPFLAITVAYLAAVGFLVASVVDRTAGPDSAVLGCIGFYGLMSMLLFVNRSHPWNVCHVCIPVVGLATYAAAGLRRVLPDRLASGAPYVAWGVCLLALAVNPNFRAYPSLVRAAFKGSEPAGLCLMPGVCGLPESKKDLVAEFDAVTREVAALHGRGESVCVLDPGDTMYYLASGVPPQDRYSPLMACMIWQRQVDRRGDQIREHGPDWVAMKSPETWRPSDPARASSYFSSMDELGRVVAREYNPVRHVGSFVLWHRKAKGPSPNLGTL